MSNLWTPRPWELIETTEHHGPYATRALLARIRGGSDA